MLLRYCVKKDTMATPVSKVIDISGGSFVYCLQKDKRVRLRRKLSACYHPRLPAAQIIPFVFLNHFFTLILCLAPHAGTALVSHSVVHSTVEFLFEHSCL